MSQRSTDERLAVVESTLADLKKGIEKEKEAMTAFKTDIYKRLDWIKPAILVLAAIMILLHPTVGSMFGIIK